MALTLYVDTARWRAHHKQVQEQFPGLVPVCKGNGYGFGHERLADEATRLGSDILAVGTTYEAGFGSLADDVEDGCGDARRHLGRQHRLHGRIDRGHLGPEEELTSLDRVFERPRHRPLEDWSRSSATDRRQEPFGCRLVITGHVCLDDRGERIVAAGRIAVRG